MIQEETLRGDFRVHPAHRESSGLTPVELLVILTIIVVAVALSMPLVRRALEGRERAFCANNLKQIGLSMKMYANENAGRFPPLALWYGTPEDCSATPVTSMDQMSPESRLALTFNVDEMCPDYFADPNVLICPTDPNSTLDDLVNPVSGAGDYPHRCAAPCRGWTLGGRSYTYLGYCLSALGELPVPSDAILWGLPFAADPENSFWADAVAHWNQAYPDKALRTSPAATLASVVPLDMTLVAWSQVIGDTLKRGDPADVAPMLTRSIWVGPPESALPGAATDWFNINDFAETFTSGRHGVNFDWTAFKKTPAFLPPELGGTNPYQGTGFERASLGDPRAPAGPKYRYAEHALVRVHDNIARFLISDMGGPSPGELMKGADSQMEVMWDKVSLDPAERNHADGTNILFLDGHVEFQLYDQVPPASGLMSESSVWTLSIIQNYVDTLNSAPTGDPALDAQCP